MNNILILLQKIRFSEVLLMTGFPFSAFIFLDKINFTYAQNWILIFCAFWGIYCLFQAVYLQNSYLGKREDAINKRLTPIKQKEYIWLMRFSYFLIAGFIALGYFIPNRLFIPFGLLSLMLWIAYSYPRQGLKYRPFTGTLIHLVSQIIHFLMIWGLFEQYSMFAFSLAIYTALLFSAGHINHEMIDFHADKLSGIKNTATTYGINWCYDFYLGLLALTIFYLIILLCYFYPQEKNSIIIFSFAGFIHLVIAIYFGFFHKLKMANNSQFLLKLRHSYRFIYLISGIVALILKIG